ncbi:hypothetical protein BSL82_00625 [Tardibacter chloracetimidivorans]|uniref:Uncharacterized protein n=1 Tax=Tardibacter chloracetimidivorans TaxID=1921510 RepID=A0A1L3ZQV1_9SPHN|nr:hypothetical protein [Tardibacter chloracetimidivorans]API57990.1 hypothetical protein BSL82_00625 [Tardibacter chloracetimidivorans]
MGGASPTYDANGNLTFDGTLTYGYDVEGRLTSVKQGAITLGSYAFDAQGRRKSKSASGTTTIYVTDADNREVLEYDGDDRCDPALVCLCPQQPSQPYRSQWDLAAREHRQFH